MTTTISNSQGRYIAYSQGIDKVFFENHDNIVQFKSEKMQELLKENPFNLGNSSGRQIAYEKISSEIENKISDLAGAIFKDVRNDIAFSVLSSYLCNEK